ncbi:triose-phosphate isomerase [Sulfurimonas sp. HSL3-7]|uniref:triose-phosphate isomerase n=1 Tax=Sulfonitrofixus jiaomeiensis TaxID=3131938 RepID=UPI0031F7C623
MIIAANFKTNMTRAQTAEYYTKVSGFITEKGISSEAMIFPPATAFNTFEGVLTVGAQNAFAVENGAYTGEIGLEQLDEFGIKTILVGHSERRHILGESQELIIEKFNYYKEKGFTIVYCIGEPIEVREEGNEALMNYLDDQFEGIDLEYEKLIIAYEPVWAIGTGVTPSEDDVELIHTALRQKTSRPLLYGGSVKTANAKELLALNNVDGALIGSGALNAEDFCTILSIAENITNNREGK